MESTSIANSDKQNQANASDTERWASLIGGGALVLFGLSQRSLRGALLAVAGGRLAARGLGVVEGFRQLPKYIGLSRFSQNLTKTNKNCDQLRKRLISAGC